MARRRNLRSISVPIVLASVAVPLAIALLTGWTIIFAGNIAQGAEPAPNVWLLVLGVIAFGTISSVLVMFAVFLAREILEVRRQDSFIDSVTHELRSPLASIKLGLQTLGREALDDENRELLRSMMLRDADRLSAFIEDVLHASRLSYGRDKVGMDLSAVAVSELVRDTARGLIDRHRLDEDALVFEMPEDLVSYTDETALRIVVRNLLDNAIKYSEPPAHVTVEARKTSDGKIELLVSDDGIGIPKSELKRIFHRFYRVRSEGVRSRRGTGLGLFVVSALVRNLGGSIEAHSDGEGAGTQIRLSLPGDKKRKAA